MGIGIKEIAAIQKMIYGEREKISAARMEIVECMNLQLVDETSYKNIMGRLDGKIDRLHEMYEAVCKYQRIYCSVPVTGPMARKKKSAPETLKDEEKALIHEAYEAAFPEFG